MNVLHFFQVQGRIGVVADRILIANSKGKAGKPTLTILKAKDIRQLEIERRLSLSTDTVDDLPRIEITYMNMSL